MDDNEKDELSPLRGPAVRYRSAAHHARRSISNVEDKAKELLLKQSDPLTTSLRERLVTLAKSRNNAQVGLKPIVGSLTPVKRLTSLVSGVAEEVSTFPKLSCRMSFLFLSQSRKK
jgi:hypothetical protein